MPKRTRLLIDAHGFDTQFQGSRTYLAGLYKAAIAKAPSIHFFFTAQDTLSLEREFGLHENVTFVPLNAKSNLSRLLSHIPRIIKAHNIDIAHFQYAVPFLKTCKEIVTIHDVLFLDYPQYFPWVYKAVRSPIFKIAARRADLLLTVSNYAQESISSHFHIPKATIEVLPNGIDTSFRTTDAQRQTETKPYVLYVSRWEPRKNHILLLQAFMELGLAQKGFQLVFVGNKDFASRSFDNYWQTLTPEEKTSVKFLYSLSQQDIARCYRNCRLFVYPSLAEGFGIPPIEAAASGAPVLCSNSTGMSDFTFFAGGRFNPRDKEELKLKMLAALEQKDHKQLEAIQTYVMRNYDWDIIANQFLTILSKRFGI